MANHIDLLERRELVQKLVDSGYGKLVSALLFRTEECMTKAARINKSGLCRVLGWKIKQLEEAIFECRRILGDDVFR